MKEEDAKKKICPFREYTGEDEGPRGLASGCMAWGVLHIVNELDESGESKRVHIDGCKLIEEES